MHRTNAQAANTVRLTTLDIQLACIFASSSFQFRSLAGAVIYII